MPSLRFEIHHPNGQVERCVVDNHRALVGSAAHCEIRLPPEHSAPATLTVEVRDGHLFAEALSNQPMPLLDGQSFGRALLPPGSTIMIDQLRLRVSIETQAEGEGNHTKSNPRVYLLGALFVAAAAYAVTHTQQESSSFEMPEAAPPLWAEKAPVCPQSNPQSALARANELRVSANDKRERSPFVPREGVAAVPMYRQAAACFTLAGRPSDAHAADRDADRLANAMLEDYRLARLRLERALVAGELDAALIQIRLLNSMLETQSGEYVSLLGSLERRIMIRTTGNGANPS
jgi:hypothetical protein